MEPAANEFTHTAALLLFRQVSLDVGLSDHTRLVCGCEIPQVHTTKRHSVHHGEAANDTKKALLLTKTADPLQTGPRSLYCGDVV